MKVEASAPSNIALIKYMGKSGGGGGNVPTNASLSYTLEHLRSFVTIEAAPKDSWEPLPGFPEIRLTPEGRKKFLDHFARLKREWDIPGAHVVRSANNFPSDCGLASSASSFAALTLATWKLTGRDPATGELSRQSRQGSGSSCRSFFSPWALWRGEGAEVVDLRLRLEHAVVIVGEEKKRVSSSEAHRRVTSSLLFQGRAARAEARLGSLLAALGSGTWRDAFGLCWSEFQDMHVLFETSEPAFGYFNQGTVAVLQQIRELWEREGDGPLVTMDAGANVHLLLRPEQTQAAEAWLAKWKAIRSWG